MKIANKENSLDKRIKSRKLYSGTIFFTAKNGLYEGRLTNFSRYVSSIFQKNTTNWLKTSSFFCSDS